MMGKLKTLLKKTLSNVFLIVLNQNFNYGTELIHIFGERKQNSLLILYNLQGFKPETKNFNKTALRKRMGQNVDTGSIYLIHFLILLIYL